MLSALTMTNANEAIGIAKAAQRVGTASIHQLYGRNGRSLPTGQSLAAAIAEVDEATGGYPAYFMINCAHPSHFADRLLEGGAWVTRIRGVRANASRCSHAELDAMTTLDDGDPEELAQLYNQLLRRLPHISVLGGCCGTDIRHIGAIARSCAAQESAAA